MQETGVRPETICLMVYEQHPGTGRRILPWLPTHLRLKMAYYINNSAYNYWPRTIRHQHRNLYAEMRRVVTEADLTSVTAFDRAQETPDYRSQCSTFVRLMVGDLQDLRLKDYLVDAGNEAVLFTGGGIVPKDLVSDPD